MTKDFTLTIRREADGVRLCIDSEEPVSTCEIVGALEMCKLMAFENRIPKEGAKPRQEPSPGETRRELLERTRKVLLADEPLSLRAKNTLEVSNIRTLEDLLRYTKPTLRRLRNVGRKTYDEIVRYVTDRGYEFGSLSPIWIEAMYGYAALSDNSAYRRFADEAEKREWISRENARIIKEEEGTL